MRQIFVLSVIILMSIKKSKVCVTDVEHPLSLSFSLSLSLASLIWLKEEEFFSFSFSFYSPVFVGMKEESEDDTCLWMFSSISVMAVVLPFSLGNNGVERERRQSTSVREMREKENERRRAVTAVVLEKDEGEKGGEKSHADSNLRMAKLISQTHFLNES
jgi:hypothetical protein